MVTHDVMISSREFYSVTFVAAYPVSQHWRHDAGDTGREIDNDAFSLIQHSR